VTLNLVSTNESCASLAGYAIYIWHCKHAGLYSLYSSGVTGRSFAYALATRLIMG